jgi:hypothetical protein
MTTQKQLIIVTQIGPRVEMQEEIEGPIKDSMYLPGVELYEMRSVGGSSGASVRIVKGFWLRQGKTKSQDELTKIDEGSLTITYKNLTFAGNSNTISIPLNKIVRMQPYRDGIGVYKEGRQREYRFSWGKNVNMKLIGFSEDDGKIKPLGGFVVNQFIIGMREAGK